MTPPQILLFPLVRTVTTKQNAFPSRAQGNNRTAKYIKRNYRNILQIYVKALRGVKRNGAVVGICPHQSVR
jgi:hypothetical protein